MKTKHRAKKGRRILRGVLCVFCAAGLFFAAWQFGQYQKLQSIILPPQTPYQVPHMLPDMAKEAVLENRQPYMETHAQQDLDQFRAGIRIPDYDKDRDARMARQVLEAWQADQQRPEWIALEQAKEDLQYLHSYIKYGSAHYGYYGGEAVFGPVFDEILTQLTAAATDGAVPTEDFSLLLREQVLWVVRDLHAHIDGASFRDMYPGHRHDSYYTEEIVFDQQLRAQLDDGAYTLRSIDGEDPMAYLQVSILQDGALGYIPWVYTDAHLGADQVQYTLTLEDQEGRKTERVVRLTKSPEGGEGQRAPYELREEEDYFYLVNSTLQPWAEEELRVMIRQAPQVRGVKPVVIDLRDHGGGWDLYGLRWIFRYLGISPVQFLSLPIPSYSFDLQTQTALSMQRGKLASGPKGEGLGERYSASGAPLHIANDTPLFVLMDRGCGSSGEWFISYLRRMDNVVLVGEPSAGMVIGGNTSTTWLPNSRIKATFSMGVGVDSDLRDHEEVGYKPDIYVPSAVAGERIAAMLGRS